MAGRPQTMRRTTLPKGAELHLDWRSWEDSGVLAAPLDVVAVHLDQPLELVQQAAQQVEPYWRADQTPVWSIKLLSQALGLQRSRLERRRELERQRSAARRAEAAAQRAG